MIGVLLAAALGAAQGPVGPVWEQVPDQETLRWYYPPAALRREVAGQAVLACVVTSEGLLADCAVASEEPAGLGFGEAALAMQGLFKVNPRTRDGAPVAGMRVRAPIRFDLFDDREESAPAADLVTNLKWRDRPNGRDMAITYPDKAVRENRGVRATLQCLFDAKGALTDCRVVREDPAGYGAVEAALKLSRLFKAEPLDLDGKPVQGRPVRIPIYWTLGR